MLRLPPFRFRTPPSLEEAARIVAGEGTAARLVAGGTDLWPNMKRRHQKADTVISLMAIPGLGEISSGTTPLTLGATAILEDVARHAAVRGRYPTLARAVSSISSPPLRWMGTIGGNVCVDTRCTYYDQTEDWRRSISYCMKEEGTVCWVAPSSKRCLAHSASDSAPVLSALGATVRLVSTEGEREIPVADLYRDDGIDYLGKRPEEIVTAITLPDGADATRCRSSFWKLRRRGSIDFAVLSAAVALWLDGAGRVERASIVLGAVASRPLPVPEAAALLLGQTPTPDLLAEAARLAAKPATPFDNTDFQAQWRKKMVERYVEAALREAVGLPAERLAPKHTLAV
ncbi:MAG: FAD binding domain-containing protein [Thermoanaerobaculia bacterium]